MGWALLRIGQGRVSEFRAAPSPAGRTTARVEETTMMNLLAALGVVLVTLGLFVAIRGVSRSIKGRNSHV